MYNDPGVIFVLSEFNATGHTRPCLILNSDEAVSNHKVPSGSDDEGSFGLALAMLSLYNSLLVGIKWYQYTPSLPLMSPYSVKKSWIVAGGKLLDSIPKGESERISVCCMTRRINPSEVASVKLYVRRCPS